MPCDSKASLTKPKHNSQLNKSPTLSQSKKRKTENKKKGREEYGNRESLEKRKKNKPNPAI